MKQICPQNYPGKDYVKGMLKYVHKSFIHDYVANTIGPTHGFSIQVMEVFEINRPEDAANFRFDLNNR